MKIANPVDEGRGRWQLENNALIADERECDLGMPDRLEMKLMLEVATLGVFGPQEFPARRQIVEDRAHFDLGAGCFAAVAHGFDLAAGNDDLGAGDGVAFASG